MVYKYEYEMIDGRDCMTGWHAWNDERFPIPETDKAQYAKIEPPRPDEMIDEYGRHRYVRGTEGPVLLPAPADPALVAEKEKQQKVEKMKTDLAVAMVENSLTLDDFVKLIKANKGAINAE